ncbi:MAG: glycosyltransferase [Bacteroidetes bacterium]|nr:glycosyltransferase [Bacteroidota bacterium]
MSNSNNYSQLPFNASVLRVQRREKIGKLKLWLIFILFQELLPIMRLKRPFRKLRQYRAYLKDKLKLYSWLKSNNIFRDYINNNTTVYSYWLSEPALISAFIKKDYSKLKFVSRAHGYDVFEEQSEHNFIPFKKFKLSLVDTVYSVSNKGAEHLTLSFPQFSEKIKVAYLGVSNPYPIPDSHSSNFYIATCSIIRDVKRLDLMIDILKNIKFDLVWHVLGDGPDLNKIKELNKQLPNHIKVIYHGFLGNEKIFEFYRTNPINLFVSLSYSEGLPVSMMEAQSFGIPIMSTDVGGCREICNESTGILLERDFVSAEVAQLIMDFKNSKKNTISFRQNCRKFWENNFNAQINYRKFAEEISA